MVIPFVHDLVRAEIENVADNCFVLDKSKYKLRITFPTNGVATTCVQTIALTTGTDTAGNYRPQFHGQSTNELAYNTSAANIAAALQNLEALQPWLPVAGNVIATLLPADGAAETEQVNGRPAQDWRASRFCRAAAMFAADVL